MSDIFHFLGMGNDLNQLLPVFLKQYWYIFILAIALCVLMIKWYNRTFSKAKKPELQTLNNYVEYCITSFITIAVLIIVSRGGTELKPISVITAAKYVEPQNTPLVLNTPFTILKSLEQKGIEPLHYLPEHQANQLFNPIHLPSNKAQFKKLNVVVIILESFSYEYIGSFNNNKGYTPFLDSLIKKSMVCINAYANAKRSIEALPAIIAGLPHLMEEPYITSVYGNNNLSGLGNILKPQGYNTSFFHGATNGTMNFDSFTHLAGFDRYYGRKEYNNDSDYDGSWGIWDEPYLQYFAKKLSATQEPFLSAVFTLSSHHPFSLPEKYTLTFPEDNLEIHKTVRYTDYALGKFFETAEKQKWFNNTLFIITADHTGISKSPFFNNDLGMFKIPVIFYQPGMKHESHKQIFQEADILSTTLDYLHYPKPYFSFGNSAFDTLANHFAATWSNNIFQLINDKYLLQFNGESTIGFYDYRNDSLLKSNLHRKISMEENKMEEFLKAYLQEYNDCLIHNKMGIK